VDIETAVRGLQDTDNLAVSRRTWLVRKCRKRRDRGDDMNQEDRKQASGRIHFVTVFLSGTGSKPPGLKGWHLPILRIPSHSPRKNPWIFSA